MKRLISFICAILLCTGFVFAEDNQGDEYYDDFVYTQNGEGDQFIKFGINGFFPLNFNNQLFIGGAIDIGYYRFISNHLAVGGETTLSYSLSVGRDVLYIAPFTFGVMYQPEIGKFEFPLTAGVGFAMESWANLMQFPALVAKASAGAFYRISEGISLGTEAAVICLPQWTSSSNKNFTGFFATANISARFHF